MNRRGVILPLVLVGILATVALIPFLVTNTETITKNITAIDESNRIYWAAEGAACDAYKKSLKSNSTLEMATLTIDIKDENIKIASSPRFQYNNDFVATTTLDTQSTIHEERACWTATGGAKDYNFEGKLKVTYVKPGVNFNDNDGYIWDKNGFLYRVRNTPQPIVLRKVTQIKEPVWQMERKLILCVDGKVRKYDDGSEYSNFSNEAVVIDAISNNKFYRITKDNNVLNSNGEKIKWKNLFDNNTGNLDNIVQIDGRNEHIFALNSNGELYGWGNNKADNYPIIRRLGSDGKTIKTSFSEDEAVLIKTQNVISNSVYDITFFVKSGKYLTNGNDGFFEDKFGKTPHHCREHQIFTNGCPDCASMKSHPWTNNRIKKTYIHHSWLGSREYEYDFEDKNCMCELCNEIREIDIASKSTSLLSLLGFIDIVNVETKLDPRSTHTDTCHCEYCWDDELKINRICLIGALNPILCDNPLCKVCPSRREHFWGCHCDDCNKYRKQFYNNENLSTNKVPNPSTPLHLEEDTKIIDLQLLVDGNSAFFCKDSFYNKKDLYRSSVEFRAKFVPKNPPTIQKKGDVGTYKDGATSSNDEENLKKIYIVEGGKVGSDTYKPNTISNLPNVWIIKFGKEIKKGGDTLEKLPKGDYEVIFESRLKIEEKIGDWEISSKTTNWKTFEPYNMLWGVDKEGVTNNNKYFGCIFRLNEYLFNVTSGRLWEPHKVCAVSAGENFSVILAKNTKDAIFSKREKYKIMSWGDRGNDNDPDYRLGRVGYLDKKADRGEMAEVVFKDDNDNVIDVAQYVRSIKTGKIHTLVLTDYLKNDKRIQELWTWGAKKFQTPKKLTLELDAPIVSIACGDNKNLLITENNTVYQWGYQDEKVNSNHIIPIDTKP